jgi:hypothetical protein
MDDSYFDNLRKRFNDQLKDVEFSEQALNAGMNKIVINMVDELAPPVCQRLGLDEKIFKKRLISVRMTLEPTVNGYVTTSDGWDTFEMAIHVGLMIFYHKMIKIFAGVVGVMGEDGKPKESPKIPFEDIVSVSRTLMKAFWENRLMKQEGLRLMQLSDAQIAIASLLLNYTESFTVAHELGHIVMHLSPDETPELLAGKAIVRRIIEQTNLTNSIGGSSLHENWANEFAADLVGLGLVLQLKQLNPYTNILRYSSAELALLLQHLLESFHQKILGSPVVSDTHPPSILRISCLRTATRQSNPDTIFQLGEAFEKLANEIMNNI